MTPDLGLAPGQKWRTRGAGDVTIVSIDSSFKANRYACDNDDTPYPVELSNKAFVTLAGEWLVGSPDGEDDDLIERLS